MSKFLVDFDSFSHKSHSKLGTVAHNCNPSYLEGRDQGNHGSRTAQEKSYQDPLISTSKVGVVMYACDPSYDGDLNTWRSHFRMDQGKNCKTQLEK
jgi:hypothetical protein